jgi:hypothetical protein
MDEYEQKFIMENFEKEDINFDESHSDEKVMEENEDEEGLFNLKPLPMNLKYAFLDKGKHLPIIIGKGLSEEEELKLIGMLSANKEALGWSTNDIKGISLDIVQHCINLEDEFHLVREPQRRLNPNLKDVVKNEIIKWLDNTVIYPI